MIPYIVNRSIDEVDIEKANISCTMICIYGDYSISVWLHGWNSDTDSPIEFSGEVSTETMYLLGDCFYDYILEINKIRDMNKNRKILKKLCQQLHMKQ